MIHLNERSVAVPISNEKKSWHCDSRALDSTAPDLSVIVPVYNEAETIGEVLRRVLDVPVKKQVIVVDDASTDGTIEVLDDWRDCGAIELVRHHQNQGKGAAIRTALVRARGKFTIIQDADLEYDPLDYAAVIEPLMREEADVVYGSRYASPRGVDRRNWLFRWGVGVLNLAVRALYGVRLSDEATCYKAFPTPLLQFLDLECERFEFCPEVTAKVCRMGLRIKEVPISYHPRGASEGKKLQLRDGVTALRALWKWRNWQPPANLPWRSATAELRVDDGLPPGGSSWRCELRNHSSRDNAATPRWGKPHLVSDLAEQLQVSTTDLRTGTTVTRSNWHKYHSRNPVQRYLITRFLECLCTTVKSLPAEELLDVGCGEGIVLNHLRNRLPQLRVAGIDCDAEAVAMARNSNPTVPVERGDIYKLPCPDQSSDVVMALEVLEHLKHPRQALAELRRVTRRFCLVSVPNEPWFRGGNFLRGRYVFRGGNHPEHLQKWSSRQFVRLVAEHFQVVGVWRPFPWTLVLGELPPTNQEQHDRIAPGF